MTSYWLMKSEPHVYSWENLVDDGSTHWDGVRNYQARNIMRDEMKLGDKVLFYHSNCKPPHVAGVARVCKESYPDFTANDPTSKYFDPKSNIDPNIKSRPKIPNTYVFSVASSSLSATGPSGQ